MPRSLNNAEAGSYEKVLSCDLCQGAQYKIIDDSGAVVQCKKCGLRFINQRLIQEDIARLYDAQRSNWPGWGRVKPQAQLMYQRRYTFVERFIRGGKILDVGAGLGEFLSFAQKANKWQCFGTETARYSVEFVRERLGIDLSQGQLEELNYPDNFFDVVAFWHVLEHLPYPSRAIEETARILKNKGFLFIAVPNDSWLGRPRFFKNALKRAINRLPLKRKFRLKKMYPSVDEPGNKHLFYFTPRTLTKLLNKYGFKVSRSSVDYDYGENSPQLERKYRQDLLLCKLSGINFSNAILIAAQKRQRN